MPTETALLGAVNTGSTLIIRGQAALSALCRFPFVVLAFGKGETVLTR